VTENIAGRTRRVRCDVAIIGAGISGLSCARTLASTGLRVVVIEARRSVGGRIRTYCPPDGGPSLELGAQVIHGDRNPLVSPQPFGLPVPASLRPRPVHRTATARVVLHGEVRTLAALASGGVPPWEAEERLTASACADIPVASWLTAEGLAGDQLASAAEWFSQNWAAQPHALSARGVAVARRGDQTGRGEYGFEHGYGSLTTALAADLDVRLRLAAKTLEWSPGNVKLGCGSGPEITGRAAVIAVPPPVVAAGLLRVTPMPAAKAAAASVLVPGDGCCLLAVLSRPAPESAVVFDADGRSGFVSCTAGRPEVLIVAKASAADQVRTGDPASLISRALPWSAASRITGSHLADWGRDRWSAGAFTYPRVGALWAGPAWAQPVERTLFFAGEATTAGKLPPSVHGAAGSGLLAARQVLQAWGL
jgi:monoamine oxidase